MSVASMATARLMETWAHGQDIVDGLHTDRTPTDRLRHIVHLGVRTRGYSFAVGGRAVPATPVRIELTLPSGTTLEYGPTGRDRVDGTALDFCLVVTRRRHVADTGLVLTGSGAQDWLDVAQTFAGDPGPGRYPGQFPTGLNLGTGANSSPLAARQITSAAAPLDAGRG
jgi:uncharacterized protein (TIGR03084 family)